jgi:hypothetical protein
VPVELTVHYLVEKTSVKRDIFTRENRVDS